MASHAKRGALFPALLAFPFPPFMLSLMPRYTSPSDRPMRVTSSHEENCFRVVQRRLRDGHDDIRKLQEHGHNHLQAAHLRQFGVAADADPPRHDVAVRVQAHERVPILVHGDDVPVVVLEPRAQLHLVSKLLERARRLQPGCTCSA